jgi:signal transduction histidine kinase
VSDLPIETVTGGRQRAFFRGFLVVSLAITVALLDIYTPPSIGWGFLYLGPVVASAYFFGWMGGLLMIPICLTSYHWIGFSKSALDNVPFHTGNTWLELGGMAIACGFTSYIGLINRDLQEAKRTLEANLRQKEIIFQSTAGGLLLINHDLALLDVNPPAAHMLGIDLPTFKPGAALDQTNLDGHVRRFFSTLPKAESPVVTDQVRVRAPAHRELKFTATRIGENGHGTAWAVAVQDLTDLMDAHEVLLSKAHTLAVQDTRNRMARDLHDNLAQTLATIHMRLGLLRESSSNTDPRVVQQWERVDQILIRVLKDVRQNIWELRPTALEHTDFVNALQIYIDEMHSMGSLRGELKVSGRINLEADREVLLFYVIQESLTNAQKHSAGEKVKVDIKGTDREVLVVIRDDGKGFDMEEQRHKPLRKTYGLTSMQERINLMGGRCTLTSAPGQGTEMRIMVPVKKATTEDLPS